MVQKSILELEEFKDVISEQDIVDIAKRIYGNGYEGNDLLEFNSTKYTNYFH